MAVSKKDWRVVRLQVGFLGREWYLIDIATLMTVVFVHCLALLAPFHFTWGAFGLFVALYFITGLGITLGYHRILAHRSLKLHKGLEYFFAYCGVVTLQGSPVDWVSTHRYHHQFTDTNKDPHSPIMGLWFSHIGWIFDYHLRFERYERRQKNADDLRRQAFYRFLHHTYLLHPVALGLVFYALGGLPYLVWGTGVRIVVGYHVTFSVNSICHTWGKRVWDTGDLSRNNWAVGLFALGEGWHNNHHAFENSARLGLEWWQIDFAWYVIRLLQQLGLATDVKTPTQTQKTRKPLYNKTKELSIEEKVYSS